jgi:hypothetical protein
MFIRSKMTTKFKPFVVGIDPGKSTGVGILRRATAGQKEKVVAWTTRNFHTVQGYLETVFEDRSQVKIFIELPPAMLFENQTKAKDVKFAKGRDRIMAAVGGVRQEAKLLFEMLLNNGWDCELVAPVREKKWDARRFKLFTGSGNRANQHEMDACRLAIYYANKR